MVQVQVSDLPLPHHLHVTYLQQMWDSCRPMLTISNGLRCESGCTPCKVAGMDAARPAPAAVGEPCAEPWACTLLCSPFGMTPGLPCTGPGRTCCMPLLP